MGKVVRLSNGSTWVVPDRPPVGVGRIPWKQMAENISLVRSADGRLYCRVCRSHFEEEELRKEFKSLKFCSSCAGWNGVAGLMQQRQDERLEVFYQLGFFERR
jgi:hypothetical protein